MSYQNTAAVHVNLANVSAKVQQSRETVMTDALCISVSVPWRADISSLRHCSSCANASSASRLDRFTYNVRSLHCETSTVQLCSFSDFHVCLPHNKKVLGTQTRPSVWHV